MRRSAPRGCLANVVVFSMLSMYEERIGRMYGTLPGGDEQTPVGPAGVCPGRAR